MKMITECDNFKRNPGQAFDGLFCPNEEATCIVTRGCRVYRNGFNEEKEERRMSGLFNVRFSPPSPSLSPEQRFNTAD